jgi:LEA14-like dessication related protein
MMRHIVVVCLAALLTACATLTGDLDPPKVTVENVESLPNSGSTPRFLITLRIANPNKQALDIVGVSYSMELLGKELITGVTNEVPRIEAYGEQTVELEAGVRLFELLRLLAGLGLEQTEELDYRFEAKIDFEGFLPTQRVEETGVISLK